MMLQQLKSVYWLMMDSSGKMDFANKTLWDEITDLDQDRAITRKWWWKSISPMAGLSNFITAVLNRSLIIPIPVTPFCCCQ